MADPVSTGIHALDRKLGGGIPPGHTALFTAPPASQAELLLSRLASANETLYLSAERSRESVETTLGAGRTAPDTVAVLTVGGDDPLRWLSDTLERQELPDLVVVDRIDIFERVDADRYRQFTERLHRTARETDTAVVLFGLRDGSEPDQRTRTGYVADIIAELRTEIDQNGVESRLSVPKFRGGCALDDTIGLELTERVFVDTSRDIA